eukprot:3445469-Amphidinium_carterae.3
MPCLLSIFSLSLFTVENGFYLDVVGLSCGQDCRRYKESLRKYLGVSRTPASIQQPPSAGDDAACAMSYAYFKKADR